MKVEVVCSWCHCPIEWKDFEFPGQEEIRPLITHGICPVCLEKEMAEINAMQITKTQHRKGDQND